MKQRVNDFLDLSDNELSKQLKTYAEERKGEIADLCYAASVRIAVLAARIHSIREEGDDDLR